MRSWRQPPPAEEFDRREIPVTVVGEAGLAGPWFRLYRVAFANQFHASTGSRLTPASGEFPCCSLGASVETTVAEVWGDRLAAHRDQGGNPYVITTGQAREWAFLRVARLPDDLKMCDLTDAETLLRAGLDAATLYATDLSLPRMWAERIARHPAGFDGIRYLSRHNHQPCLVLWERPGRPDPLSNRLVFEPAGEFLDSEAAHRLAGKIGIRLAFSW